MHVMVAISARDLYVPYVNHAYVGGRAVASCCRDVLPGGEDKYGEGVCDPLPHNYPPLPDIAISGNYKLCLWRPSVLGDGPCVRPSGNNPVPYRIS